MARWRLYVWRCGGVVTQRSAKPCTPVQFRSAPPNTNVFGATVASQGAKRRLQTLARMAELVYAFDLKSNGEIHMGSSPISGTKNLENFAIICYNTYIARFASVAQLFRALPCQGRGRELESLRSHH